ncbi:hypothetical protein [Arcanobacterium hippocoleae]|uniref:hypothetical protein n=1 Tax=Arcanobacterium hippocoleae TaxID=149017 RepID=UPI00333F56BE
MRSNGKPNREPETLRGVTETPRKMANRRGPLKNQKPKIAAQRLSRKQRSSAARNSFFEKITHLSKDQITILVLALIVLALLAVFAFSYVKSQINEYHETKTAPAAAAKFTPIACTDENLELKLEVAARKGETGAVFNVLFRNPKTTAPCLIDAGYSNVKLNVVSGDAQVWNSQVCAAGVKNKQLLIGKGVTSKQGYIWNGVHAGSGCKGTSLAQPGTYRVQLSVAGKNVVDNYPFIINSNGTISIPAANAPAE